MTDEEREDAEALRWYMPAGVQQRRPARDRLRGELLAAAERVIDQPGILVTVRLNGDRPSPRQTSGENMLAAHRPTRYALIMRRERANVSRKQRGLQQRPAMLPGSCGTCAGLGVINGDRERCPTCRGSGEQ